VELVRRQDRRPHWLSAERTSELMARISSDDLTTVGRALVEVIATYSEGVGRARTAGSPPRSLSEALAERIGAWLGSSNEPLATVACWAWLSVCSTGRISHQKDNGERDSLAALLLGKGKAKARNFAALALASVPVTRGGWSPKLSNKNRSLVEREFGVHGRFQRHLVEIFAAMCVVAYHGGVVPLDRIRRACATFEPGNQEWRALAAIV
jgi:hypothetical protein